MEEEKIKAELDIFDQGIKKQIDLKVSEFRQSIYNTYGVKLYIAVPNIKFNDKPLVTLDDLWDMTTHMVLRDKPYLAKYTSRADKTRLRDWMYYYHAFNFLARRVLGYTYISIGNFHYRNHASIVHSVKQAGNMIWCEDPTFAKIFDELKKKLRDYVETFSEDTKV